MNKPWLALAGLLAFTAYTAWSMTIASQSLLMFGLELASRPDTLQVLIDLYLMALLACVWMYHDARRKGRPACSVVPYWALTALFVSLGPLLYLVVEGFARQRA